MTSQHAKQLPAEMRVIGVAGGGMIDARWAANAGVAKAGHDGEVKTARITDAVVRSHGSTILHDLALPMSGITANIDHIAVSGRTVQILDSKSWRPGFFWTLAGRTRRGTTAFPSADKQTMKMASVAVERFLRSHGIDNFDLKRPVVVVWPTHTRKKASTWAMRMPGARIVQGHVFKKNATKIVGTHAADASIVSALKTLVATRQRQASRPESVPASERSPISATLPASVHRLTGTDPYSSNSYTQAPSAGYTPAAPDISPAPKAPAPPRQTWVSDDF